MLPIEKVKISPDEVRRVIGTIQGEGKNEAVFFSGIHGNEPAGIIALQRVIDHINNHQIPFYGKLTAFQGNLPALKERKRYIDIDLNRIWFTKLNELTVSHNGAVEFEQKKELKNRVMDVIDKAEGGLYFFDLHTTSSQSVPFMSFSDTLRNRRIVEDIPVPIVLGMEEKMEGTLFSYLSELGISSVIYESGQHEEMASVDNHEAFIWLVLEKLGFIEKDDVDDFDRYSQTLAGANPHEDVIFELITKYHLDDRSLFKMDEGFVNFQKVKKGQRVAEYEGRSVLAPLNGWVFMPLYQDQGNDGFFMVTRIRKFWLNVSVVIRRLRLDRYLSVLPGISKHKEFADTFFVNRRIARFLVLELFHLLGYRKVSRQDQKFVVKRRPFDWHEPDIVQIQARIREIGEV